MNPELETDKKIKIIQEKFFVSFLEWISVDDNLAIVFTALIQTPSAPRGEVIYLKLYSLSEGVRGLINEITGWLINYSLNIPQSENAYVINVPLNQLKNATTDKKAKLALNTLKAKGINNYWCFGTSDLKGKPAASGINFDKSAADLDLIKQDISEWKELHKTIAADEHMANPDRHLNNLIRTGNKSYAVIDNGVLCTEKNKDWTLADLSDRSISLTNKLSDIILGKQASLKDSSKIFHYSQEHENAIKKIIAELEFWCLKLISTDIERHAYYMFMLERAQNVVELVKKRYNIIG